MTFINKSWIGKKVTCFIDGIFVDDAIIHEGSISDNYWICYNKSNVGIYGHMSPFEDYSKHKYANFIGNGSILSERGITNLKLVEEEIPDLQKSVNNTIQKAQTHGKITITNVFDDRHGSIPIATISNGTICGWNTDGSDAISTHSKPQKEEKETTDLVEAYTTPKYIDLNPIPIFLWSKY